MIKARAELDAARENTRRQIESVVAGISREYEVARANEAAVERALSQSKADIQGINRKEFQLGVLEREVQQNRNLYDMFVGRLKETSAAGDLQSTIARVVDPATVPGDAYAPKKAQIVGIASRPWRWCWRRCSRCCWTGSTTRSIRPPAWSSAWACRRWACCS